nr:MAG TPA: hypothetical protein [Caudoviricetes sp.]
MDPHGGIEPLDFHPTLLCQRFRRPLWGRASILIIYIKSQVLDCI